MTDDEMALLELLEKGADADLIRDMLAFASERVMEVEVEVAASAAKGARTTLREAYATATANGAGTRGSVGSSWPSRGCARAPPSLASLSPAGPPRTRWWPWCRRPRFMAFPPAPSMIW
jgi:hypothetical protein